MRSTTVTRLLLPLAALALGLAACGGGTGDVDDVSAADCADEVAPCDDTIDLGEAGAEEPAVSAPLPPADDEAGPVTSTLCAEDEPDCDDTLEIDEEAQELPDGGTQATCLAGATDCADDPSNGVDVARPIPLDSAPLEGQPMNRETTNGATGAVVVGAFDTGSSLSLAVDGTVCDVVEDVLVIESPTEVRVLVLTGTPEGVDCEVTPATRTVEVELQAPLGDRQLLDLAG